MKSKQGWAAYGNGTNSSGFSGLPGGDRYDYGAFFSIGSFGGWWSSTESSTSSAWFHSLSYNYGFVFRDYFSKTYGFSVRCLRD